MFMADFRGDIRRAIFRKVRDNSIDITKEAIGITNILGECSKRYENFDQLEKLNIEITVPIQIPPNREKGDCKAVVLEVEKSLSELGGGARIYHATGSWLDEEKNVVSDQCIVVYSAISINKWFECIPVLQRLIQEEIQTKLFQKCVFLRVDNQTFGNPLNLLGQRIKTFPSINEFGGVDPACLTMMRDYEEHPLQTVIKQEISGDGNKQIASNRDTMAAFGEDSMVAGNDIHVHHHGIDPKEYANLLNEKNMFKKMFKKYSTISGTYKREQND